MSEVTSFTVALVDWHFWIHLIYKWWRGQRGWQDQQIMKESEWLTGSTSDEGAGVVDRINRWLRGHWSWKDQQVMKGSVWLTFVHGTGSLLQCPPPTKTHNTQLEHATAAEQSTSFQHNRWTFTLATVITLALAERDPGILKPRLSFMMKLCTRSSMPLLDDLLMPTWRKKVARAQPIARSRSDSLCPHSSWVLFRHANDTVISPTPPQTHTHPHHTQTQIHTIPHTCTRIHTHHTTHTHTQTHTIPHTHTRIHTRHTTHTHTQTQIHTIPHTHTHTHTHMHTHTHTRMHTHHTTHTPTIPHTHAQSERFCQPSSTVHKV